MYSRGLRGLAEDVIVTVEAVRVLLEVVRVIIEAVRKIIETVRLFLEAVSAFDPVWTKPLRFFFDLAWFRTNLFALLRSCQVLD